MVSRGRTADYGPDGTGSTLITLRGTLTDAGIPYLVSDPLILRSSISKIRVSLGPILAPAP